MGHRYIICFFLLILGCSSKDDEAPVSPADPPVAQANSIGCPGAFYQPWESSHYVLPYPVGETYKVHLSHCSGSYHSPGEPDAFAVDFEMNIGSLITASRRGTVVHIEERGLDGEHPNNLVVVKHDDETYAQYMHLTQNGAIPEIGDIVEQGDSIGLSGATGLAIYPHLHFVVTTEGWEYPYVSVPHNFKNTEANPRGPQARKEYTAEPY